MSSIVKATGAGWRWLTRGLKQIQPLIELGALIALIVYTSATLHTLRVLKDGNGHAQKSADAAQLSAQTAARQLELSERPWMSPTDFHATDLNFKTHRSFPYPEEDGATLRFTFKVKNVGKTVALRVYSWAKIIPRPFVIERESVRDLLQEEMAVCSAPPTSAVGGAVGDFIFPEDERSEQQDLFLPRTQVDAGARDIPNGTGRIVHLLVATCTAYQFPFSLANAQESQGRFHRTMKAFWVVDAVAKTIANTDLDPEGQYPSITLRHEPLGDFAD
jgi:hypothetical protein